MLNLNNDWDEILKGEFLKEYYLKLREFLKLEYKTHTIYPDKNDLFNALKFTAFEDVKVLILGQDPYHGAGQAHGLAFSVKKGVRIPPSLKNIYKEINADLKIEIAPHGELTKWAKDGVLLLNTCLSVREGKPNSHKGKGWETFTDEIIRILNKREEPIVFILWGANAKTKQSIITNSNHLILTSVHPSPLSAFGGFFGCEHFSKANDFLVKSNIKPIDWEINS